MSSRQLILTFNHPLVSVFLRNLAWERFIAGRDNFRRKDIIEEQVANARKELGLEAHAVNSGAPHDFIGSLFKSNLIVRNDQGIDVANADEWRKEWRLLYVPQHNTVRQISFDPIVPADLKTDSSEGSFVISLRDTSLPRLRVFYGEGMNNLSGAHGKGVYFLNLPDNKLYIGKTDEMGTRMYDHFRKKNPKMWVFMSPEADINGMAEDRHSAYTDGLFSLDALNVTESVLISYWAEICNLGNSNRGADKQPAFFYLQQGISVVKACSAVIMWLTREHWAENPLWSIPFRLAGKQNWGLKYLGQKSDGVKGQ